jgi:two-component system, NarL family, response regulator NreC
LVSRSKVQIVLADDHQVVRGGLKHLLEAEPDFEVVAEAGDIASTRRCVRERQPSVLVLDLNMPGGRVLDSIPALRSDAPDTQIVVLTMRDDLAFVDEARRAGAIGYVLKEEAGAALVTAIRRATEGERYINRQLAARLVTAQTRDRPWD